MTLTTFAFILAGVILNAGAQLLLKAGTNAIGVISLSPETLRETAVQVIAQWHILAGLFCYVVSVGVWIVGLSRVEVSVAYPMLSLGYVVNAFAAWWLFGEALSLQRLLAIGIILIGVYTLARS